VAAFSLNFRAFSSIWLVDIYGKIPIKLLLHGMALAALLANVAFAQNEPKKISKAEAMNAISSKVQPDYPPVARQLRIEGASN
jgi:hypothetical protein